MSVVTNEDKLEVVGKYRAPVWVDVAFLVIDVGKRPTDYQRVQQVQFEAWNWNRYDPIRVRERDDGKLHVVAGGHRTREARRFGIPKLPAFVGKSEGAVGEADEFVVLQKGQKALSAIDVYRAAVVAKHDWAIGIRDTLKAHGLAIGSGGVWPFVRSVYHLRQRSIEALDFACGVIVEVWDGDSRALGGSFFTGLMQWYTDRKGIFDRAGFVKKVGKFSARAILQRGSNVTSGWRQDQIYARVFDDIYTSHSRRDAPNANGTPG
jgi:hypothetical protein